MALHKHKKKPRLPYVEYTEELAEENLYVLELEYDLQMAIQEEQFEIYYQAKVDGDGKLSGAEALIRWNHPNKGLVSPFFFIPLLEESGQIFEVGDWVLRQVSKDIKSWKKEFGFDKPVSANVSMIQLDHPDFYDRFLQLIDDEFIDHYEELGMLEIEVTESAFSEDQTSAKTTLEHIQELGIHLSIDDFGTGYSNLNQLIDFPFDVLKIDRSFVKDLPNDLGAQKGAKLVIGIAKSLGKKIVAEGVEDKDQHDWLILNGVDIIQGFYWAKPLPKDEFLRKFFL